MFKGEIDRETTQDYKWDVKRLIEILGMKCIYRGWLVLAFGEILESGMIYCRTKSKT